MKGLAPTPADRMVDAAGRPYFLWDMDWTLEHFARRLREAPREERAWLLGKLMRQAKPDDVFEFVGLTEIRELWPDLERYLGRSRPFWTWLLDTLERGSAFERVRVGDGRDLVMLDLVADPMPALEPPETALLGDVPIRIDSRHEILVNKLCAILARSEIRDLSDIRALLERGGDLARALADAPRKDVGFSPLTFVWVLQGMSVEHLATAAGHEEELGSGLVRFRDELVQRVLDQAGQA